MQDLTDRTILVTGASKGIGRTIVESLGAHGARVIAQYSSDYYGAVAATKNIDNDRKLLLHADFSDPKAYEGLWNQAIAWAGKIDVLVSNAAVMPEAALTDSDEDWATAWSQALNINASAPAFLIRKAVLHFLETGGGSIIGISSWAAVRGSGNARLGAYAASKAPVSALLKTIARNYQGKNISTYLISPGVVRTAMSEASARSLGGEEAVTASLAMAQWVPPTDIAETVTLLATGKLPSLNGSTIDINGASYIR